MPDLIAFLGDSSIDNAPYTQGKACFIEQMEARLPLGWDAIQAAADGAVINDIRAQYKSLPKVTPQFYVISIGGSEALGALGLVGQKASTVGKALNVLEDARDEFTDNYSRMLQYVKTWKRTAYVCTLHYPNFADREKQSQAVTGLSLFNDMIHLRADKYGVGTIELRNILTSPDMYANETDPSSKGSKAMVEAICTRLHIPRD